MTKEDAILLAVANARGLCRLTELEARELDCELADSANELRRALTARRVALFQRRIASYDPTHTRGLGSDIEDMKNAIDHQREVEDLIAADWARSRSTTHVSNPIIDACVAAAASDVS